MERVVGVLEKTTRGHHSIILELVVECRKHLMVSAAKNVTDVFLELNFMLDPIFREPFAMQFQQGLSERSRLQTFVEKGSHQVDDELVDAATVGQEGWKIFAVIVWQEQKRLGIPAHESVVHVLIFFVLAGSHGRPSAKIKCLGLFFLSRVVIFAFVAHHLTRLHIAIRLQAHYSPSKMIVPESMDAASAVGLVPGTGWHAQGFSMLNVRQPHLDISVVGLIFKCHPQGTAHIFSMTDPDPKLIRS